MVWLIIGYMYLYIHRPFEVWPVLGEMRLELLYMMCGYWLLAARQEWRHCVAMRETQPAPRLHPEAHWSHGVPTSWSRYAH